MTAAPLVTDFPRPEPAEPRPYHFPRFERHVLDNGLGLVVAPVHKLPVVTLLAVTEAGAVADPTGREGIAQLAAAALGEGAAAGDGAELTRRFERLGTSFDAHADWDVALAQVTVTASRLEEALPLFASVLTTPTFPAREIERLKAERLAELLQQRTEPRGLADDMFARFVYAAGARYARAEGGEEETVRAITRDDVAHFWAERYRPGGTTLVVAGDVTVDEARRLVEKALGSWRGEAPPSVAREVDAAARLTRAVHLVDKADAPQSELRLGHVGLPRLHPDYFPVTVMNALLGGLFNSRINLNLRERHGYTYGAFSHFDWRRAAGPFVVSTAVANDVTHLAAQEALKEVERFGDQVVDERELTLATDYLDGVFPIRFETTSAIAGALAGLVTYGLPEDYYDRYREQVRAVTPDDVRRVAREHLYSSRLQLVVVGDAAPLRDPLEELGFGPLTVYDADGVPRD
ncbi:MAG TPA: pitrilysin family protein [Gemmatimonadaceae bacterium]|nr:pitrilysin family protein [Gemmatimonadaceae bacterium]